MQPQERAAEAIHFVVAEFNRTICCRRGTRTTHGAVSYSTTSGGQPQSLLQAALCCVFPVITTPETGGHVCQFRHPTR
jgi:hypothetical protein